MRFTPVKPPRVFSVGRSGRVRLKDCGRIRLGRNEQVTFLTASGAEYDVVRKPWGFYATPSLNHRLVRFRLRAVLVRSLDEGFYILLVERGEEGAFRRYLRAEGLQVVRWLDRLERLAALSEQGDRIG